VVRVGPPWERTVPAEVEDERTLQHVMLLVECHRILGKEVSDAPLQGALVRLSPEGAELVVGEELSVFDDLRMRIHVPGADGPLDEVYAKVVRSFADEEGRRYRVRFTSVPEAGHEVLAELAQTG